MEKILIQVLDSGQENTNVLKIILEKKSYFHIEFLDKFENLSSKANLIFVIDPINNKFNLEEILDGENPVIIASNLPVSQYTKKSKQAETCKVITYPFKKIEVLSHLYDHMGPKMRKIEALYRLEETFYPIKPKLLKNKADTSPFNIYLKVGPKHLKVLETGSKNFDKALSIYEEKGVKVFFINQSDYFNNRDFILSAPKSKDGSSSLSSVNEFFHGIVEEVGLGKSTIKLADKLSSSISESLNTSSKSLLKNYNIQNIESEFIYNHSYLTSLLCIQIVSHMGLDTRSIGKKLITASLFHDLAISDPKVATLEHFSPEAIDKSDIKTRNLITNHHLIIANILQDHIEIDGDTIQIIKDSHIDPTDKSKLNNLRPLSFIFNIAHTYIVKFYQANFNANKNSKIIEEVAKELECEKHQSIIEVFKESF